MSVRLKPVSGGNAVRDAPALDAGSARNQTEAGAVVRYRSPAGATARDIAREAFLDDLYLVLKRRADRNERSRDRRLLDRGQDERRSSAPTERSGMRPEGQAYRYLLVAFAATLLLMVPLATLGYLAAPQLYSASFLAQVGKEFGAGYNFAFFDLNIDMRELRRQHIRHLETRPEVVVLGASHWQEAHSGLVPHRRFYNAHVHRDYYEDLLAVVEMLIRHRRLPDTLLLSIRDMTFAPLDVRSDTLWLTALPDYRAMAARLDIPSHSRLETGELARWLGLLSLPTTWSNVVRWATADALPGATREPSAASLDVVNVDGSVYWSRQHRAQFTPERTLREVQHALQERRSRPPVIDRAAVDAVDRLLGLLSQRGVRIVLAHPPFNPDFYGGIEGTPYGEGLQRVEALTERLARKHGAIVVGSFDPAEVGCGRTMYIDSEHSSPECLRLVLNQIPDL
ncbi:MAG TPA: hypothetical protein VLE23_04315 [Geminicoccaceae bacterium]|nr:hypothetical protein [Geminicoccaceae bacterium]